jgi:hypothetical protein
VKLNVNFFKINQHRREEFKVDGPNSFQDSQFPDPYKQLSEIKDHSSLDD